MKNLFAIILIILLIYLTFFYKEDNKENYGALSSLYSNDGIQDRYLTIDNDKYEKDNYSYWRNHEFHLPTRNLERHSFYPYTYSYNPDRYQRDYALW
tara:strand:- start:174 stop:464 length:291 start_codon:yes stop_codon:yes gene_type:complete